MATHQLKVTEIVYGSDAHQLREFRPYLCRPGMHDAVDMCYHKDLPGAEGHIVQLWSVGIVFANGKIYETRAMCHGFKHGDEFVGFERHADINANGDTVDHYGLYKKRPRWVLVPIMDPKEIEPLEVELELPDELATAVIALIGRAEWRVDTTKAPSLAELIYTHADATVHEWMRLLAENYPELYSIDFE